MLLAAGSNSGFLYSFLGIIALVLVQLIVLAIIGIFILHYIEKKKKRKRLQEEHELTDLLSPQQFLYKKGDEEYIGFDHSALFNEYRLRLASGYIRNKALLHDLNTLKDKYDQLLEKSSDQSLLNLKNEEMKTMNEQLETAMQTDAEEKEILLAQVEELNKTIKNLSHENESLLEQLSIYNAPENEKDIFLERLQAEKKELRKKLMEQEWLQEALNEKRAEIGFLQNQLEQRIRQQHGTELEKNETVSALDELKTEHAKMISERDDMKNLLLEKNEELMILSQELQPAKENAVWLENQLRELKDQNEILHATAADSKDEVAVMQDQLSRLITRLETTEQKLSSNKKMMRNFYDEFSRYIKDVEQSPVIPIEIMLSGEETKNEFALENSGG